MGHRSRRLVKLQRCPWFSVAGGLGPLCCVHQNGGHCLNMIPEVNMVLICFVFLIITSQHALVGLGHSMNDTRRKHVAAAKSWQ